MSDGNDEQWQTVERAGSPVYPPDGGSGVMALGVLSTLNAATIVGAAIGACYLYDHAYRRVFLGSFGIDPSAVTKQAQDAVVDGFEGLTVHVAWVALVVAVGTVAYLGAVWLLARLAERMLGGRAGWSRRRTPSPIVMRMMRDGGLRVAVASAAGVMLATTASIVVMLLVGLPAESAGRAARDELLASVVRPGARCSVYRLRDARRVVGLPVAASGDRKYVLAGDLSVAVLRLDDVTGIRREGAPCVDPAVGRRR